MAEPTGAARGGPEAPRSRGRRKGRRARGEAGAPWASRGGQGQARQAARQGAECPCPCGQARQAVLPLAACAPAGGIPPGRGPRSRGSPDKLAHNLHGRERVKRALVGLAHL